MKVGLYIPCFNAEKTIQLCLEAVFSQTYPIEEIIVVDDGSTDNSMKIASGYPVKIIKHMHNQGLATARNTAVKNINSELIASLDADCQAAPGWLAILVDRINTYGVVGAGGKLVEAQASVYDLWRTAHMKQSWENEENNPPFLFGSNTVFKKDVLLDIGLYKESLKNNYEDVDVCSRLRSKGYKFIYESEAIARHLKCDNINSLLDTYWKWNLGYYQKNDFYSCEKKFLFKIKDNIGLANRYLETDIKKKRKQLLYLDFFLAMHHSLRDLEYFLNQEVINHSYDSNIASLWLSLSDLLFFYHWGPLSSGRATFLPKENSFCQNFFAMSLILGKTVNDRFGKEKFKQILFKDLLFSTFKINDHLLVSNLSNLRNRLWDVFLENNQSNIHNSFLKQISLYFKRWIESLISHYPGIIKWIEDSAYETSKPFNWKNGGGANEK
jgi:glycosyltransferase involved in cell wall biosynthesis